MKWVFVHVPPLDGTIQVLDTTSPKRKTYEKAALVAAKLYTLVAAFQKGKLFFSIFS